jgi:hypothetical protein
LHLYTAVFTATQESKNLLSIDNREPVCVHAGAGRGSDRVLPISLREVSMYSLRDRWSATRSSWGLLLALLLAVPVALAQPQDSPASHTIPEKIMHALTARFPGAEIQKWTREKEDTVIVYDIEFTQEGRKYEADITEDGSIHNWEMAIKASVLPPAVRIALERRYPGSTIREVMEITEVHGMNESLRGYEILIFTADGAGEELTVSPEGEILEDSGNEK